MTSEKAMVKKYSPFLAVKTLSDFIFDLIGENDEQGNVYNRYFELVQIENNVIIDNLFICIVKKLYIENNVHISRRS